MKNALISPNEKVYSYDKTLLGVRVAEVSDNSFEVAPPLFWVACADNVLADQFYYDLDTQTIIAIPVPPKPPVDVTNTSGNTPDVIA